MVLLDFYKILENVVRKNEYNIIVRDNPYRLNSETSAMYPAFSYHLVDIEEKEDTSVVHIRLFGIDRETNNGDNFQTVISNEVEKLKNIISTLADEYGIMSTGTKKFNPISDTFSFGDKCNGVVLDVYLIVQNDTICNEQLNFKEIKVI